MLRPNSITSWERCPGEPCKNSMPRSLGHPGHSLGDGATLRACPSARESRPSSGPPAPENHLTVLKQGACVGLSSLQGGHEAQIIAPLQLQMDRRSESFSLILNAFEVSLLSDSGPGTAKPRHICSPLAPGTEAVFTTLAAETDTEPFHLSFPGVSSA